jgi:hypothetical protein
MKLGTKNKLALTLSAVLALGCSLPSMANNLQGGVTKTKIQDQRTYLQKHPVVKKAAVGAGVGTAAGALTGLISGKGMMRGAAIGAGTGAGVGMLQSSKTLKQHPVASKVATGTVVGLGLGLAANKGGHNTKKRVATTTGIGAALGLGAGLLKNEFQ